MPILKTPAPHQSEALVAIASATAQASRATVVMACGTGKTLLELWAAQAIDAKRTVVFVPTLNLLQQVFHEWRDQWSGVGQFRPLCVCSDSSVGRGDDEIELRPEDLDFPTSTHPGVVNEFLDAVDEEEGARAVIFCTYQSAHVLGTAMGVRAPGDRSLGLGIFDEAHKTVGDAAKSFAFALSDKNLALHKRLFFTATPRVINDQGKRDEDGDLIVFSMDNPAVYGEHIYTLSFAEAARRDIIVPYRVVISVVDDIAISSEQIADGLVMADGQVFDAAVLANQIALRRTMDNYGLKKAITFHSTVASAEQFARSGRVGLGHGFSAMSAEHVSARQSSLVRDGVMQRFRAADIGVVSNARCLTEGVDVPAVDVVAFMDPKKSKVDIVQAAGRAMRKAGPSKTHGYILLPLHLSVQHGESPVEAVERGDFSVIADVLRALAESDEELYDSIQISAKTGGSICGIEVCMSGHPFGVVSPDDMLRAIETRLILEAASEFDLFLGRLERYRSLAGHCEVPQLDRTDDGYALGKRCNRERMRAKLPGYPMSRRQSLEKIGFRLNVSPQLSPKDSFDKFFKHLKNFVEVNGHCKVPKLFVIDGYALGQRVKAERQKSRKPAYSEWRRSELASIGFDFDPNGRESLEDPSRSVNFDSLEKSIIYEARPDLWDGLRGYYPKDAKFVNALKAYYAEFGHVHVRVGYVVSDGSANGYPLGSICRAMRMAAVRQSDYPSGLRMILDALGFYSSAQADYPPERRAALELLGVEFPAGGVERSFERERGG